MTTGKVYTFTVEGNRMFFPSWLKLEGENQEDELSALFAEKFTFSTVLGLDFDDELMEIEDVDNFPHVQSEITSHMFAHGAATVYVFAGPYFDEVAALAKDE